MIDTEAQLDELLTRPGNALVEFARTLTGPLVILGAAGIFASALETRDSEGVWRFWLIAGLVLSPLIAHFAWGAQAPRMTTPLVTLAVSGLLVGFGTRLGSGCTSGHGVCGIARLSPRSMVATAIFMATGFATVFIVRHVLG